MKVLLINGSPRPDGVINFCLTEMSKHFDSFDIMQVDPKINHCINCRACKDENNSCIKEMLEKIKGYDAYVFGSPTYYGGITSQMKAFLTKLFYSNPKCINNKPIALVVSSRRGGSVAALNEFALPFLMHSNIIVGSTYWNEIYGDNKEEAMLGYEGLQTLHNLAENLKWVAECLSTKEPPKVGKIKHLNFISREYINLLNKENGKT